MAGGAPIDTSLAASAPISRRVYWMAFALITSLFFLWGFSYGLLDVLNKHFQTVFGITKLQSTGLQATYFGAYLVWSYPAGIIMRKFGYKKGIYMGLGLYSTGAILFWPMAHFQTFGGFCGATFIIGCGLATLEVGANSYVAVLGKDPKEAAFLLNFAQSFNGLAAFTGPLMASNLFFKGANAHSLTNVQYVYLAVSILGALVAIAFYFCPIPEISESSLQAKLEAEGAASDKALWKRHHVTLGFVTQLFYVGAQVATASFVLNLATECKNPFTSEEASRLFGYMQITFMVARFVSTALLKFVEPTILLGTYGLLASALMVGVATSDTRAGVYMLFGIFFFESTMYPTIFTTATSNTGALAKKASGLLVMGVAGGAAWPPMQGALADATSTHTSYFISFIGFVAVTMYGYGFFIHKRWFDREGTSQVQASESFPSRPESFSQTPTEEKKEFDGSAPISTLTY